MVLLVAVAAFVWVSAAGMPATVASHFGLSGAGNGYMSRAEYRTLFAGLVVILPAVVAFLPGALLRGDAAALNIPNKQYWLAPGRRDATLSFLENHSRYLGVFLAVFLAFVHWLVVKANEVDPPALSGLGITGASVVLLAAMAFWLCVLLIRFRAPT